MKRYSVNEFLDSEAVFHLSNPRLKMIVINRNDSTKEVVCRWIDSVGKSNKENYYASELAKFSDKEETIIVHSEPKRNNRW